jgi:hypothetical protein
MGNRVLVLKILLILSKVSRAETFAAGTTRRGVGIFHFEAAVLQGLDVIQFAAGDVKRAFGIHDDAHAAAFDQDVAVRGIVLQVHFVLQTGAAAADDGHAQYAIRTTLFCQKRRNFARRVFRQFNEPFIADAKIWR